MTGHEEVELLLLLKRTVEGLLTSQVPNVWSIYGGLNRLHSAMERIFKHGYRVYSQSGDPDLWVFINGLVWLQPNLATSPTLVLESYRESPHVPPHILKDSALLWLYKSLETHTLSQKLSWLLSDREHLLSCYEKSAFLSQEKFGEAALICLRAVEHNQSSLLTEINPCLYMTKWNHEVQKTHRRCSSYPETLQRNSLCLTNRTKPDKEEVEMISSCCEEGQEPEGAQSYEIPKSSPKHSDTVESLTSNVSDTVIVEETVLSPLNIIKHRQDSVIVCVDKVKAWSSLPSIIDSSLEISPRDHSLTVSSKPWLITRRHSPRSNSLFSGSQTVPSSPCHSLKLASSTPIKSIASECQTNSRNRFGGASKLSPSVLKVDYSYLQHSDCSDMPAPNVVIMPIKSSSKSSQARSNNPKNVNRKSLKSGLHSKSKMPNSSSCGEVSTILNKNFNSSTYKPKQPNVSKTDKRYVPLEMNHIQTTESITSNKPPQFEQFSRRIRQSPTSNSKWTRESSLVNAGTPLSSSRKSFMEDGGSSVQPMSTGFFPRPFEGQSLFSFLSSGQFSRANAELDRENAHFNISEAMIAAIEQVKCNSELQTVSEHDAAEESDEEINHLKQRLRLRRHQRQEEQRRLIWGVSLLSDGKTDTTTTDQSVSSLSTSPGPGSPSDSISSDEVEDMELDDVQNMAVLKDSGLSMSMASLYSEAELCKQSSTCISEVGGQESVLSAESVALSLIRQFSEKQLPRASDLKWLISEQEVQQQLLPLPKSWPVNPDDPEEDMRQATPLRGNMEWAPPRPQIIFTPHPNPVRRTLLVKQNFRCAGCGMKVAPAYADRFRYCEYLGRYFCTGCHLNQKSVIPGRILTKWDFTRVPVSSFSYRLLDQMFTDPLFSVRDHGPSLYRKSKALERCRKLRLQLYYLKDFLFNCRFAKELQEVLEREPIHIYSDVDVYSMNDFQQVKQDELPSRLQELVSLGVEHVQHCQLCAARGFICELCSSKEIIFPWQLGRISRCDNCGSCCHTRCRPRSSSASCPRCMRMIDRCKVQESQSQGEALIEDTQT